MAADSVIAGPGHAGHADIDQHGTSRPNGSDNPCSLGVRHRIQGRVDIRATIVSSPMAARFGTTTFGWRLTRTKSTLCDVHLQFVAGSMPPEEQKQPSLFCFADACSLAVLGHVQQRLRFRSDQSDLCGCHECNPPAVAPSITLRRDGRPTLSLALFTSRLGDRIDRRKLYGGLARPAPCSTAQQPHAQSADCSGTDWTAHSKRWFYSQPRLIL